jgi:hypothetical protein
MGQGSRRVFSVIVRLVRNCARERTIQVSRDSRESGEAAACWIPRLQGMATAIAWDNPATQPQALALPDGQNTQMLGQSGRSKIFNFTEIRKGRIHRGNPAQGRGAYRDRHERGPGGGGRRPYRREGFLQGRQL